MDRIKDILNNSEIDEELGLCAINDTPETPNEDLAFLYLFMYLQSDVLNREGVKFPTWLERFEVHIEPLDYNLDKGRFSLEGIEEEIMYYKESLKEGKSFLKTQVLFEEGELLPTLVLHFFTFLDKGKGKEVLYESLLYPFTFHEYPSETFTRARIKAMGERGINTEFIRYLPNTELCPIHFDGQGILMPLKAYEKHRKYWGR